MDLDKGQALDTLTSIIIIFMIICISYEVYFNQIVHLVARYGVF